MVHNFNVVLRRQKQLDVQEFKASLLYIESSRLARVGGNTLSQIKSKQTTTKYLTETKQDCHWLARGPGLFIAVGVYSKECSRARKGPAKTGLVITGSDNQNL